MSNITQGIPAMTISLTNCLVVYGLIRIYFAVLAITIRVSYDLYVPFISPTYMCVLTFYPCLLLEL